MTRQLLFKSSLILATTTIIILQNEQPFVQGNPKSRPYVAYRTDPFDQEIVSTRILSNGVETRGGGAAAGGGNNIIQKNRATPMNGKSYNEDGGDPRCPLSFRLGSTHSTHFGGGGTSSSSSSQNSNTSSHNNGGGGVGMHTPPIIYPLHPDFDAGSGRQILLTTDFEVLEMWTPSSAIGTHADYNPNKSSSSSSGGGGGGVEGQSSEQMKEDEQFPLLFESSSFYYSSPIVHDVEGDGVADAILGDYDGNLHLVGLDFEHVTQDTTTKQKQRRKRYYKRISIPRLFIRKSWFDVAINRTKEDEDMADTPTDVNHTKWEDFEPYHTYFASTTDTSWRGEHDELKARGISANVLNMDLDAANGLAERKKKERRTKAVDGVETKAQQQHQHEEGQHRRLQEADIASGPSDTNNKAQPSLEEAHDDGMYYQDDVMFAEDPALLGDDYPSMDSKSMDEESSNAEQEADAEPRNWGDDHYPTDDEMMGEGYDDYAYRRGYGDDMYEPQAPDGWDSYEEYQSAQDKYYHDSNYLRLPPHLLSTCTLVELPRAYAGSSTDRMDKIDEMILCSVSYYFDEDECKDPMSGSGSGKSFGKHANADGGDETEEERGRYVANAIMGYNLRWNYWSIQEVLDLSTDWSAPLGDIVSGGTAPINSNANRGMGAWALATPIAVKLDGGGKNHIIVGTSMGLVYALEAQWHGLRSGWPVQMRHPVEQKVLVEDVVGNTNLEVFVVSTGGDLVSLNADGGVLWARNLMSDDETSLGKAKALIVRGTSPLSMGDVDGTGRLAIVVVAMIASTDRQHEHRPDKHDVLEHRLYAIDAVTGDDLEHFPIILNKGTDVPTSSSIPQPLLIDLHEDQSHWLNQIHGLSTEDVNAIRQINKRAAADFIASSQPRPHGGAGRGVHIVQPLGSSLHIIEGSTACSQTVDVDDTIPSMVQADDVHGTGGLDLVVTTSRGEILTLESDTVSYHPLNVWNAGVTRAPGSSNAQAHGFSSTQGIFVHPMSRVWRDILGVYVPITFEIFDRRPNIANEPNRQVYEVEVRAGMSAKRTIFYQSYNTTGIYTERVQIPFGPGYFSITVSLHTTHGIVYEDTFHIGFNVDYMGGLWLIVFLPLVLASIPFFMFRRKPNWEEDEDYGGSRNGILGRAG